MNEQYLKYCDLEAQVVLAFNKKCKNTSHTAVSPVIPNYGCLPTGPLT